MTYANVNAVWFDMIDDIHLFMDVRLYDMPAGIMCQEIMVVSCTGPRDYHWGIYHYLSGQLDGVGYAPANFGIAWYEHEGG